MSLTQITLTTNKSISNVGDFARKIGQGERGQVLPVLITDANGAAYDLTGKKIVFSENKDSGKFVVDDGVGSDAGKITPTDLKNGKFSYTLQEQVYPESGTAWFDIVSQDGTVLDTTRTFQFIVIPSTTMHVESDSYSSTLSAFEAHYQGVIKNTETNTQNLINSLTDKIGQAISNGQKDVANQLNDTKAKLQQIQNQENALVINWTNEFNQRKSDFDKLQSDWQKQSKQISDDYTAKASKIASDARSQHDAIQARADQQLRDNNSANSAAIAKIQNDAKAKLDGIEKAKNDAIAKVNSEKEIALQAADNSFKAKIAELQSNYDAWKSTALTDLNKQLQQIKSDIGSNKNELTDFQKKLDYTKTELSNMAKQLDSLDFTKFVTGDQFKEAMSKKASGLKVMGLGGEYVMAVDARDQNINAVPSGVQGLADIGVLSGALQVLADAILDKNHYTKDEVNQMIDDAKNQILTSLNSKANVSDLNGKADKTQIQSMSNQITSLQQEVAKNTPVHVKSVDDVAKQTAHIVIVDD